METLPTAHELQYFLEVAGTLNISRAAERLGVTQPTLSLAMRRLESAVGAPLLVRGKNGVQLTRAGQRFSAQARELLERWGKLRAETLRERDEIRGHFTLGCHPSVALYTLPHCLPALLRRHAELTLSLVHDLSRRVTEAVVSCRLDFGIAVNPVAHPDLVIHELMEDEVTLWAAPGVSGKEGALTGTLIADPELFQTQEILRKLKRRGEPVFPRVIASSNLEVITSLVAAGAGVGVLPGRVAKRVPQARLRRWRTDAPVYRDRICLVYRPDLQKGAAPQAVLRALRELK
ncbi:MAG: LysR family transcriptional regulator [Bacteriovoracia bacterium]